MKSCDIKKHKQNDTDGLKNLQVFNKEAKKKRQQSDDDFDSFDCTIDAADENREEYKKTRNGDMSNLYSEEGTFYTTKKEKSF